jgi:hypothetical protein
MSENVVSLVDRRAEIDPDLLRSAEALLDLVRSGRADGLVWAAALRDGHAGQTSSAGKTSPTLLGTLSILQAKMLARALEESRPAD